MSNDTKPLFKDINRHCLTNNSNHHTNKISEDQLIVRRGQAFKITVLLSEPFQNSLRDPLFIQAITGMYASQELGTMSLHSVPEGVERSPKAKAVWSLEVNPESALKKGELILSLTPPANAPVGEYVIMAEYKKEEQLLAMPMVLFNPWCPEDAVYMKDEPLRQEYVMNESGLIWRGSARWNSPKDWDFGQFEDNMVTIGQQLLDLNHKHKENPGLDVSMRWDPGYVGRVISAMINSEDDKGVLEGNWSGEYSGGKSPGHWSGSHEILSLWVENKNRPVRYGQCWVFAGVMCSVMRFFGIPCRVVTNFASAHDNDGNLTIDKIFNEEGEVVLDSDSVWNFHVWTEACFKRHDIENECYGGWQVLDPTPQELSDGVYCCGPSPKEALLYGEMGIPYDTPFIYAEVNADCVEWLRKEDGTLERMETDTAEVGKCISTKAVGKDEREDITCTYKSREGSFAERLVFKKSDITNSLHLKKIRKEEEEERKRRRMEEEERRRREGEATGSMATEAVALAGGAGRPNVPPGTDAGAPAGGTPEVAPPPPPQPPQPPQPKVNITIEEVSKPTNGKDVCLNLKLNSKSTKERTLIITYNVQAMHYNGQPTKVILKNKKEETLKPGKDLTIPVVVKFSDYCKPMLESDGMKVSVVIKDKKDPDHPYHADDDVVLEDPPISVKILPELKVGQSSNAEVIFTNPVDETLKNCTLTVCGTGLWKRELEVQLGELQPNRRIRVKIPFTPYKCGDRKLVADFDCSVFRDIKCSCSTKVRE